jgi:hypothetical protein
MPARRQQRSWRRSCNRQRPWPQQQHAACKTGHRCLRAWRRRSRPRQGEKKWRRRLPLRCDRHQEGPRPPWRWKVQLRVWLQRQRPRPRPAGMARRPGPIATASRARAAAAKAPRWAAAWCGLAASATPGSTPQGRRCGSAALPPRVPPARGAAEPPAVAAAVVHLRRAVLLGRRTGRRGSGWRSSRRGSGPRRRRAGARRRALGGARPSAHGRRSSGTG